MLEIILTVIFPTIHFLYHFSVYFTPKPYNVAFTSYLNQNLTKIFIFQMLGRFISKYSFCARKLSNPKANENLLKKFGITNPDIYRNLTVSEYYEFGLNSSNHDPDAKSSVKPDSIADSGAFVAYSGKCTGRVPKAKSFVNDPVREKELGWGDINKRMPDSSYQILKGLALNFLNTRRRLFVVDGFAGWDPQERVKIRVVCTRPYHALFMHTMLVRPTVQQLQKQFSDGADYYIFNAGQFESNPNIPGVVGKESMCLNLDHRKMIILGSQYAGQMKKGVFTIMNYLMPKKGHLPLHSSCNVGKDGDVALFFGLSGTGKTALSAVGDRKLIGDDEHVWTDKGVFNIEGGCYAKCVNLSAEKEPQIYNAIRFGTVLQNVAFKKQSKDINFFDIQFTENTRAAYPLEFIPNAQIPAVTGHPNNIIFLTCDAFSVLPPVSKLSTAQALYHFYSGYTAKIAGTQIGIKEPVPTFSACFGQAFLPFKPQVYADLLAQKIEKHGTNVWLVNTGWTGGKYGVGKRISIQSTRSIINAIHDGSLANAEYKNLPIFNLQYPASIRGVDTKILNPRDTWSNQNEYDESLKRVADMFKQNFKKFDKDASDQVKSGGPQ